MRLAVVGVSHKTAPLTIRARLALSDEQTVLLLPALRGLTGVDECLLLSTCNRTEAYLVGPAASAAPIVEAVGNARGLPGAELAAVLMSRKDAAAARHAFRVACGLESMVIGEPQILSQVRRAYETARRMGSTGPVLNRLMQAAIAAGRRVRRETALSGRAASVPHAVLGQCRKTFGSVRGLRVLIVGAGEMAAQVVSRFLAADARVVVIANRTPSHAMPLAELAGAQSVPLHRVRDFVTEIDAAVVAAGADNPILSQADFAAAAERSDPLLIIDVGVPRGVHPEVGALQGVLLHDLDGLAAAIPHPSPEALADGERVVEEALQRFLRWHASRRAVPVIAALRLHADRVAEETLRRTRFRALDAETRATVEAAMRTAMRRLLHPPTVRLREAAAARRDDVLRVARDLFDLEGRPREGDRR